ncbi:MAG TPA: BMC domain-containing protein [Candidatus Ornithomonoglobus intestinigallinarum]|uniref:BMC domain-containing protein n=1 Tax=Candidatus Ornithomonoglobus intestinigallinarum TaxID=2840894 RepID=A0A9D1H1A0_9FIRM|nr:BMC domain-containing protein [Candidatus Ornithomonoglobus intestinigallinarum]
MADFSLGLVEVSALGNAIIMLDDMLKAADVEFVATERRLGGRLVTIVVRGELTSVQASVDAGVARAKQDECLKAYQVIARPHDEILKFLHLEPESEPEPEPESETAGTHVGPAPENEEETERRTSRRRTAQKQKTADAAAEKKPAPRRRGRKPKTEDTSAK